MSEFKVGDKAYYLYMDMTEVHPEYLTLGEAEITEGHQLEHLSGWFKSKQECIDAFKKILDQL